MKIAILHNAVADADSPSDRDVLVQVAAVEAALRTLGHDTRRLPCTLNFELVEESLSMHRPELIFNLVESLGGSDRQPNSRRPTASAVSRRRPLASGYCEN